MIMKPTLASRSAFNFSASLLSGWDYQVDWILRRFGPLSFGGGWFKESIDSSVRIGSILEQSRWTGADFGINLVDGSPSTVDLMLVSCLMSDLGVRYLLYRPVLNQGWRRFRLHYP